jgi:16S rRNA (cytosine967-C5)-methyltransferase
MADLSPARKAAFQILLAVEHGHAHSDDLLRGKAVNALSPADRNLAVALVLGVLRWQIRLDHQLQALLQRPRAKLDAEIRIALRMGAFQLLHMDRIPAHAAIGESVEAAKQAGHCFAAGMVNAVLRRLAETSQATDESLSTTENSRKVKGTGFSPYNQTAKSAGALAPEGGFSEDLALVHAHPAWMVERWINFYGLDAAQAICRQGQSQPAMTVRLKSPSVAEELGADGVVLEPSRLLTAARKVVSGDVTAAPALQEGRARLQDEGSQLVAELASTNPDEEVKSVLDACAAPGGKTLILAERNPQARIVACESSPSRLTGLRRRLAAETGRIECRLGDAAALTEDAVFDLVLADVPCSGTGTLGRNPEIRHRLRSEDLPRQAERQRAILRAALRAVRPGGSVVYSTCSLEPEENEGVVAVALQESPKAKLLSLADRIEALRAKGILNPGADEALRAALTPEGCLRLLPGAFGTDGFFVALIGKTA